MELSKTWMPLPKAFLKPIVGTLQQYMEEQDVHQKKLVGIGSGSATARTASECRDTQRETSDGFTAHDAVS